MTSRDMNELARRRIPVALSNAPALMQQLHALSTAAQKVPRQQRVELAHRFSETAQRLRALQRETPNLTAAQREMTNLVLDRLVEPFAGVLK